MRFRLICLILTIVVLIIGFAGAFWFNSRTPYFEPTVDNVKDFNVCLSLYNTEDLDERKQDREYEKPEDMENGADLIVHAVHNGQWTSTEGCIQSPVTVLEVLKGDSSLQGTTINVLEPASFNIGLVDKWYTGNEYLMMLPGHEYLLFLRFRSFPDGYAYTEEEKKTYMIANGYLGKYALYEAPSPTYTASCTLKYEDVMNLNIATCTPSVLEEYEKWKDALFKDMGIRF